MEIRTVGVLGCGLMGSGIAQICAAAGYRTIVRDVSDVIVQRGLANINVALSERVKKGRMAADQREQALANLTGTTQETFDTACSFVESLSRKPVRAPDRPGFIVNRLLIPYLLDAIREYEHGLGSIDTIDTAMKLGCGHPMGPFALVDYIGLDTIYYISNILFEEYGQARFAPPPLLRRMVMSGRLGRKSGNGFYSCLSEEPVGVI